MKLIDGIVEAIKQVAVLGQKAVDAGDPEKYVKSVEVLNRGVSDTYEQMRQIIVSSDNFTEEEKLERLAKLAKEEAESKKRCDEAIQGNREQVARIVLGITKGLLTCGISYIPDIAQSFTNRGKKQLAQGDLPVDLLENETNVDESV